MASGKSSSSQKKTKKEMMQEMEKVEAFRQEIGLWIIVAVSLLLFISNLGLGGTVGNVVSRFLFGVFGLIAYVFPILLLVGSFFAVSNRGSFLAVVKIVAAVLFVLFLCLFMALVSSGNEIQTPAEAYFYSYSHKSGGGFLGGVLEYLLGSAFGIVGTYIIDIVMLIVSLVLLTERSLMKSMKKGGQRVYESARENNERYREYRELKSEERSKRRMDHKVTGVSADTAIPKKKEKKRSDEISELTAKEDPVLPEVVETTKIQLDSDMEAVAEALEHIEPEPEEETPPVVHRQIAQPAFSGNFAADDLELPEITGLSGDSGISELPEITGLSGLAEEAELSGISELPKITDLPEIADITDIEDFPELSPSQQEADIPEIFGETPVIEEPPAARTVHRKGKASEDEIEAEVGQVMQAIAEEIAVKNYVYPPVSLLKKGNSSQSRTTETQLKETAAKLQQVLKTFGVNVTVTNISCGPAVTRYEIQPEMGVKVSKIVNLADDLKLNLAAADIRIEAPIPGKAAVGIEVPNKETVMVSFRELIESKEFEESRSKISFAVGKDIGGNVKVADIAKMPHLLIAGATGSGKSVCINTIIMSILYKADPNEVKLLMIDPKVVELSVYNGIPHLMIPVVTDPKKAAGALHWAVAEMTERYQKFAECGVREINGYNAKTESVTVPEGQERPKKMPQIVIIVDELADLMMVASGDVEEAICRLAQLARAAGIHLIIATQRPSVNVITGLIKANMPSRIAFAVTSGVDSRTILDMNGAEKLLGKGDMLFYPQGIPKPLRVQGAFVSDKEVSDVVAFLTENNGTAQYSSDVQQKVETMETSSQQAVAITESDMDGDGRDSYFMEAAKILIDKDKASIGMLQRYLKVGFNRAARIMDQLEEAGVVGPEEGTKPRKVLMNQEEFEQFVDES